MESIGFEAEGEDKPGQGLIVSRNVRPNPFQSKYSTKILLRTPYVGYLEISNHTKVGKKW